MSHMVEHLFRQRRLQFEPNEKGHILFYPSESYKHRYPIHVSQDARGFLQGKIWVPREKTGEIADVEGFLDLMDGFLPPEVQASFCPEREKFCISSRMDPEEFDEEMRVFVLAADGAVPACVHAGELLDWEDEVLQLAFCMTEGSA